MKSMILSRTGLLLVAVLCLTAATLGVGLIPRPASAYIGEPEWLGTTYKGSEDPYFYGTNIVAYETGDNAQLVATVVNTSGSDISIDYGNLRLGWSSVEEEANSRPTTIAKGDYGLFVWTFPVPDVDTASNLILHTFEITVQFDVTGGAANQKWTEEGGKLAVYSADQAACRDSIDRWNANNEAYDIWGYEAHQMMTEAQYLYNKAKNQYASGDFSGAKENYASAVVQQEKAIKSDASAALTGESAQTLQGTGGAKGTGYLIAGIGVLLAGIGVLIGVLLWAMRAKKAA